MTKSLARSASMRARGDMLSPGFGDRVIGFEERPASLRWLGREIAADQRFDLAMVRLAFRGLTGHEPLNAPAEDDVLRDPHRRAYEAQRRTLQRIARKFRANGHDFKWLLRAVTRSRADR